jgi:hypothetical protein
METFNLNNLETIDLNKSSRGGGGGGGGGGLGLEFLMNTSVKDKKGSRTNNSSIGLNDIADLENELNEITVDNGGVTSTNVEEFSFEDIGGTSSNFASPSINQGTTSTWDGYSSKVDELPPVSSSQNNGGSRLTERQKRQKKMMMIQKLEDWSKRGLIELVGNTHYTMDMEFDDIEDEYENALDNKRKKDSMKLQSNMLVGCVGFIETANKWINPFDVDLDGFQERITDEMGDYEDIFAELFEKYKGGKLAPEVQLLLKLGLTSATIAFTNKLFGGNPDFGNLLKSNPNIANAIQKEMLDTVSRKPTSAGGDGAIHLGGGPPPSIETKINKETSARPDLAMGRGGVFRQESGVDLQTNYDNLAKPRPEMRGPQSSQATQILSQLQFPPPNRAQPTMTPSYNMQQPETRPQPTQQQHMQFSQMRPPQQAATISSSVNALKEEFKELKLQQVDDFSITSFNIEKDNFEGGGDARDTIGDNVSVLSFDESYTSGVGGSGKKTPSKRGRKSKQQTSDKNRIAIDI